MRNNLYISMELETLNIAIKGTFFARNLKIRQPQQNFIQFQQFFSDYA